MATWVLGDIHGCADELAALIARLGLASTDRVVSVGDLFHRGPDPYGVMRILDEVGAHFILGNHEHAVLARLDLAPSAIGGARAAERGAIPDELWREDLFGDGDEPCEVLPEQRRAMVEFLLRHSGYHLCRAELDGAGPTRDGREWTCVHAGVIDGLAIEDHTIDELLYLRRLDGKGRPWWYENYSGPDLVIFGHTPLDRPRTHLVDGKLVALGLDTGCVYGGSLTAYSPELNEFASVPATRVWAAAS